MQVVTARQFLGYWGVGREGGDRLAAWRQHQGEPWQQGRSPDNAVIQWAVAWTGTAVELGHCRDWAIGTTASGLASDAAEFDAAVWFTGGEPGTTARLTLQRDVFGRVPLYWMQQGQQIWFASRWQWLLTILQTISPDAICLDPAAVYGYAWFSYVPTPLSPVVGIASLPAATAQTWELQTAADPGVIASHPPTRRWDWQEAPDAIADEAEAIAHLQPALQQAIQAQITDLSADPVGIFLSGGLDSSIVAALLTQAGVRVRAYTLDFGDAGVSEVPYAEQVAHALNIPLVKVDARPRQIRRALRATAQALDLPFGDGVTVPLYLLGEAARQEVGIIFNGEGGDQLFAGWTNKPLIAAGLYQAAHPEAEPFVQQYFRTFHRLGGYETAIFQPEWRQLQEQSRSPALLQPDTWLADALDPVACPSLLHRLRRATLMLKGAQNIQPRATNLAVAQGLQVRSPFCDRGLATLAFRFSSELHLHGSCEKYCLKRAVTDWLPEEIVWRTKRGMGVPLTTWCWEALWHDVGIWLNPAHLQAQGIWHPDVAQRIVTGQLGTIQGRRIGECLWLLLMWQVWHQTTFGESRLALAWNHPFWLPAPLGRLYCQIRKQWER